jgi:hypothetical protein
MHPAGVYELRYVYTQLKSHPNYVGDGRIKWDRNPRTAGDKSVSTPNATTLYGFGFADLRRQPMIVDLRKFPTAISASRRQTSIRAGSCRSAINSPGELLNGT